MLWGFQYLLVLALVFYGLSLLGGRRYAAITTAKQ
jgi:hypothetical protein